MKMPPRASASGPLTTSTATTNFVLATALGLTSTPHRYRRSAQFTLKEYPYCDGGYAEYYFLPPGHYVFKVPDVLPDDAIPPVKCAL